MQATAEPAAARPEKLFSQEVIVANEYRLRLERTATEEAESITGTVSPVDLFGDWRAGGKTMDRPTYKEVCDACSKALGCALEIDTVEVVEPAGGDPRDSTITIQFARKREPDGTPAAPPEETDEAKELRMAANKLKRIENSERRANKILRNRVMAEAELESCKKRVKLLEAEWEEAIFELTEVIQGRSRTPLLDRAEDAAASRNGQHKPTSAPDGDPKDNPDPIDVLLEHGLTETILKKLKGADINTMGQLVRFSEQKGLEGHSAPLTTIKGIKGATLEKLDNACAAYWAARGATVESAVAAVAESTQLPADSAPPAPAAVEPTAEPAQADGAQQPAAEANPEPGKKGGKRKAKAEANREASPA